jgi:hypothetical protein
MSDARQHLRAVPGGTSPVATQREVAVRFTAISGLIAPVSKPLNSFGWVGPATLRFSEHGLFVIAKRLTLLGLRQTQRFIPPAEIRDVYREANAVQVHLRGPRNSYFRLWAADAASAAQIVALLPTSHTVEFESAIHEPQSATASRVLAFWLVVLSAMACLGVLAWVDSYRSVTVRRPVAVARPPAAAPVAAPQAGAARADAVLATADLMQIGARIETLTTEFSVALDALMDGRVEQQKFADEMDQWLRPQWDDLEARVRRTNAAPGPLQERADGELMGAVNNWQLALRAYADDLRHQRVANRPFEYIRRAELHQWRAQQMQIELERPPPATAVVPANSH